MSNLVLLEQSGGSATLTLNRPKKHNALVPDLMRDLNKHLAMLAKIDGLEHVVLQANGSSFSTGGDVRAFWDSEDRIAYARDLVGALNEAILALLSLPCPVIANVHGPITGGSLGLMLAADLVVVTPNTFLQPYYSVVGFAPDGGWTAMLPDRIGSHRAGRILSLNERIKGEELVALGLADAISAEPALQVEEWQKQLGSMVGGSLQCGKGLLRHDRLQHYRDGLERERLAFIDRISLPEVTEGMRKFLAIAS